MKKTVTSLILLSLFSAGACAAPTDGGDGDGDTIMGAGGTGVVTGAGGVVNTSAGGTVNTGAGGTVNTGAGGTVAGPANCTGTTFSPVEGFADNGTLCGYAWTATNGQGETIDPPCGTAGPCFTGSTLCATASIPANADPVYTGVMIGWNVGQESGAASAGTWTATGTGLTVNYTATGATGEVRIIIQSGGSDYCAPMASSGQMIPWSGFTQSCWQAGGAAFTAGSPVTAVAVQINGADMAQTVSNFCLDSVTVN